MIDLKKDFEAARQAYPGVVRGLDTEYGYYLTCLKRKKGIDMLNRDGRVAV